jgi:hypothetical protein
VGVAHILGIDHWREQRKGEEEWCGVHRLKVGNRRRANTDLNQFEIHNKMYLRNWIERLYCSSNP